jgi:hypothetical protein
MRLWSIHPKYLDTVGLVACWRESLLAQSCLIKGEFSICPHCGGNRKQTVYPFNPCKKCHGKGEIKTSYYNHPQLIRFKESNNPIEAIGQYLGGIASEAFLRGYSFKEEKIFRCNPNLRLTVTTGQLKYEFLHLQKKLLDRNLDKFTNNLCDCVTNGDYDYSKLKPHPLFTVIDGPIEPWEKQT